jgi:hypothetical protein
MDHDRLRSRIRALANEVLGDRERMIFLARTMADNDEVPSLEAFADRFGVSTTRVHQIEISARRKIAASLASSGYAKASGDDVVAHLSQIRARRAVERPRFNPGYRAPSGQPFDERSFELLAVGD